MLSFSIIYLENVSNLNQILEMSQLLYPENDSYPNHILEIYHYRSVPYYCSLFQMIYYPLQDQVKPENTPDQNSQQFVGQ